MLKINMGAHKGCRCRIDLLYLSIFFNIGIFRADIHEIAEIFVDKRFAGKSVEEMEEAEQVTIFLILREDLSILPQKDTI